MNINYHAQDGLVPAIIQDSRTGHILMLGYMNAEALAKTLAEGQVTFYSRSKGRLWTKGETSGNFLLVRDVRTDCDADTLLISAEPTGPVCHTGSATCFGARDSRGFSYYLESVIADRQASPDSNSYTASLFRKGINAIAQKVGEEATELIIEAKDNDPDRFLNEAADLLFHYLVLLKQKGHRLQDVESILQQRHHQSQ